MARFIDVCMHMWYPVCNLAYLIDRWCDIGSNISLAKICTYAILYKTGMNYFTGFKTRCYALDRNRTKHFQRQCIPPRPTNAFENRTNAPREYFQWDVSTYTCPHRYRWYLLLTKYVSRNGRTKPRGKAINTFNMSCIHVIAVHNAALCANSLLVLLLSSKLLKTTTAPAGRISSNLRDEYKTRVQIRRFVSDYNLFNPVVNVPRCFKSSPLLSN